MCDDMTCLNDVLYTFFLKSFAIAALQVSITFFFFETHCDIIGTFLARVGINENTPLKVKTTRDH